MSEWSTSGTKIEEARSAGSTVIGSVANLAASSGTTAQVSVVAFSSTASATQDLTTDYAEARGAIQSLEPQDSTNMGAGLEVALEQLRAAPGGSTKTIVLLSDGMANEGLSGDEILAGPVRQAKAAGIKIYCVGFGDPSTTADDTGLDESLLDRISTETGGVYARADASDVSKELSVLFIHSQVASTQNVLAEFEGTVAQGQLADAGGFNIQQSDKTLQVVLNWPGSQLDLQLTDPAGISVADGYPGYTLYAGRPAQAIVQDPMTGQWQLGVYGADVSEPQEPYYALVSSQGPTVGTGPVWRVGGGAGNSSAWLWLIAAAAVAVIGSVVWSSRRARPEVVMAAQASTSAGNPPELSEGAANREAGPALIGPGDRRHIVRQGSNSVGRSSENNIQVDDAQASRFHAVILLEGTRTVVRDLGGVTGTLVNGEAMQGERELRAGDRLTFGATTFIYIG